MASTRSEAGPAKSVLGHLRAQFRELHPGEARVGELILDRPHWVIEAKLAEVAAEAGVSGATVVRTAQRLGYRGFPHLRVMLARDVGARSVDNDVSASATPGEIVRERLRAIARSADTMANQVSPTDVERVIRLLNGADRVLVVATGVSAPVALDLAMRLSAAGRAADAPTDHMDQQIRARLLSPGDVCVTVSGTGASRSVLRSAYAAAEAGAAVISLGSFAESPMADIATVEVLVGLPGEGFSEEMESASRIPQLMLNGALVAALRTARGTVAKVAQEKVLDIVSGELVDE